MTSKVQPLDSIEALEAAIARSHERPILIFKHSLRCGTSAMAHEEIEDLVDGPPLPADVYIVPVQAHRAVSSEIAHRLRVRHETPQALIIRGGAVVWHASHFGVTAEAIGRALRPPAVA